VGAHEVLGGASGLDVGRGQLTVHLITSIKAVHMSVTHLVPSQASRIVLAHESFALINNTAEASFVRAIIAVVCLIAQLIQLHTRTISTHELIILAFGWGRRLLGAAEVSLVLALPTVPQTIAHKSVVDTLSIIAHELVPSATRSLRHRWLGRAELAFVIAVSAVVFAIAHQVMWDAFSIGTFELEDITTVIGFGRGCDGYAEASFILAALAIPNTVADVHLLNAASVITLELVGATDQGRRWGVGGAEVSLVLP